MESCICLFLSSSLSQNGYDKEKAMERKKKIDLKHIHFKVEINIFLPFVNVMQKISRHLNQNKQC